MKSIPQLHPWRALAAFLAFQTIIATASAQVSISLTPVANPGNPNDSTGYGSVAVSFAIGVYEVTNAQYAAFLNAVAATDTYSLYNSSMSITRAGTSGSYSYNVNSGYDNKPVNFVSFYDAMRFTNWLQNGQGAGSTETGAYTLLGGTAVPSNGTTVTRNTGATWWIPSKGEWYKAAFYDPGLGGPADDYWLYAVRSDSAPNNNAPPGNATSANFGNLWGIQPVGSFTSASSYYGTYDQGGNVWEWTDTTSGPNRVVLGGDFANVVTYLPATYSGSNAPDGEWNGSGFRVAATAIPEPSTYAALAGLAALGLAAWRRRCMGFGDTTD